MKEIYSILEQISGADKSSIKEAQKRQDSLLKPMGSLGSLEEISVRLAGITGRVKNSAENRLLLLFGADNGIYEEGVSGSPQHFTKTLMTGYADNKGMGINVICSGCKTDLKLVDMGIIGGVKHENVDNRNLMINGTNNFYKEPAMDRSTVINAVKIGISYAKYAKDNNYDIIGTGEVGMGNTTTSAACIMALLSSLDTDLIGRGAGLTDKSFDIKKRVIIDSLLKYDLLGKDPFIVLESVGGLDIAAMTGVFIGAGYYRIPVVIDGLISVSAALCAYKLKPELADFMFASHLSEEPAYKKAIDEIGLEPVLNLHMRLGEGSGCPIAMQIIENACYIMNNMQTFHDINLEDEYRKDIKMK